jgi:hypothetical protein
VSEHAVIGSLTAAAFCGREIPRPAGENAGLRNDAGNGHLENLQTDPLVTFTDVSSSFGVMSEVAGKRITLNADRSTQIISTEIIGRSSLGMSKTESKLGEDAWIAKYRAAVNQIPVTKSRIERLAEAGKRAWIFARAYIGKIFKHIGRRQRRGRSLKKGPLVLRPQAVRVRKRNRAEGGERLKKTSRSKAG